MLNKKIIKKLAGALVLSSGMLLFSTMSQGAIIASFESEVSVTVTTELKFVFDKELIDDNEVSSGTGVTSIFGDLVADSGTLSALSSGSVGEGGGSADAYKITNGVLTIVNDTEATIQGSITFGINLLVNILADTITDFSIATAALILEQQMFDQSGNAVLSAILYDADPLEEELDAPDPGGFVSKTSTINDEKVVDIILLSGYSIEFYIEADASGLAESSRTPIINASAPNMSIALFGALLALVCLRKSVKK